MIGPDGLKIPRATRGTDLGGVTYGDLYNSLSFNVKDKLVKLHGDVKVVRNWTEFSPGDEKQQTGHYVPITMPKDCERKELTFKNRIDGDRVVTIDDSLTVIVRMENLKNAKQEIWKDNELYMILDFTDLIPKGKKAYDADETDFGEFGNKDVLTKNLDLSWDDITVTPYGTLKYIGADERAQYKKLTEDGNYFPVSLSPWFEGTPHKVGIDIQTESTDKNIICKVPDKFSTIVVTYLDVTVMKINLRQMIIKAATGKNAVTVPDASSKMEYEDGKTAINVSDLIEGDITFNWTDDITGTVEGTLKSYDMPEDHFEGVTGHFLPLKIFNHDGETFKYTGIGGYIVETEDNKCIFQVDKATSETKIKIKVKAVPSIDVAELDVSTLTLL